MKRILTLLTVSLFSIFTGFIVGLALDISPVIPGIVAFAASYLIPVESGILPILIFTAPGGVATPFNFPLPMLPQILSYTAATALTDLRISTQEDGVLHDFNAAFIAALNGYMKVGAMLANTITLRLATGECKRNVFVNGTTAAAGAVNFYAQSDNAQGKGGSIAVPFKSQMQTTNALTPLVFQNFTALFIPAMATLTDYADILFTSGHTQRFEREDLLNLSSYYQQVEGYIINNWQGKIHTATLRTAAACPVYSLALFIKGQK